MRLTIPKYKYFRIPFTRIAIVLRTYKTRRRVRVKRESTRRSKR